MIEIVNGQTLEALQPFYVSITSGNRQHITAYYVWALDQVDARRGARRMARQKRGWLGRTIVNFTMPMDLKDYLCGQHPMDIKNIEEMLSDFHAEVNRRSNLNGVQGSKERRPEKKGCAAAPRPS